MAVSPIATYNSVGNILASATIAASGTRAFDLDFSTKFEGHVQIAITFGTVAATSGLKVDFYRTVAGGSTVDTNVFYSFTIPSVASTTVVFTFPLPWGKYHVIQTNTDSSNSVTVNTVTTATADSVG